MDSGVSVDQPESAPLDLGLFEVQLGYRFEDRTRLENALCHSSSANETLGTESNERLEFLGDAVMALVVGHLLYEAHPDWQEGDLSRGLQRLVDRPAFAALARRLGLAPYLRLGRTEQQSGGIAKDSILSNAMEAVVGAIYLDGGLDAARDFVQRMYAEFLREGTPRVEGDSKTRFQETIMALRGEFPNYELESDSGVEGDEARFATIARVGGEYWGTGSGRTKQAAEFAAAAEGLRRVEEEVGKSG
jgi:ribonuclease-3